LKRVINNSKEQEKMAKIDLYMWPGAGDLISISPYCLKVVMAAKAKGLAYNPHLIHSQPGWVKTGKLPAAMIDEKPVLDSTNIMKALDSLPSDKPALYPADPALNADVIILEDWADEALTWFLISYRWKNPNNFAEFSQLAFSKICFPMKYIVPRMIRKQALSKLKGQGLGVLSDQERDNNFRILCQALDQKLAGRSYFVGSNLTAADIAIYAPLKQIALTKLLPAYAIMSDFANVMAFMERMDKLNLT
jgi:glutathione S-transferase